MAGSINVLSISNFESEIFSASSKKTSKVKVDESGSLDFVIPSSKRADFSKLV